MEAIFFVLIGAALFSSSWNLLGLYSTSMTDVPWACSQAPRPR